MIDTHKQNQYDLVLMPSLMDIHQDHQIIAEEAIRAFKHISILSYELPWNNFHFSNTCLVHLNEVHVRKKIFALAAYQSQTHRNYFSKEFIEGLAKVRGTQANCQWAEAFEVVRWIMT